MELREGSQLDDPGPWPSPHLHVHQGGLPGCLPQRGWFSFSLQNDSARWQCLAYTSVLSLQFKAKHRMVVNVGQSIMWWGIWSRANRNFDDSPNKMFFWRFKFIPLCSPMTRCHEWSPTVLINWSKVLNRGPWSFVTRLGRLSLQANHPSRSLWSILCPLNNEWLLMTLWRGFDGVKNRGLVLPIWAFKPNHHWRSFRLNKQRSSPLFDQAQWEDHSSKQQFGKSELSFSSALVSRRLNSEEVVADFWNLVG